MLIAYFDKSLGTGSPTSKNKINIKKSVGGKEKGCQVNLSQF